MTISIEDYLEAIYVINSHQGFVRNVDIARAMNVSKPAICKAIKELQRLGLAIQEIYQDICLTDEGIKKAEEIYHKHITIRQALINMGVPEEVAEMDCCKIEHCVSDETFKAIEEIALAGANK